LAAERVKKMLGDYVQPSLDEGKQEELDEFVVTRKAAMPDMFV
jgi:trimethylamine--corrinoid protein Co-methyltransferase